ncbi:hypothetical protein CFC21_094008 [Triticum aestivum]|uniref:Embryo surrounding factor 1 brassicaceae domain-containing protein n=2 Tax=Triticum aestivum TaxID=4565 RepID=A0A3B6QM86_WHEAT|nr:hypothetical protein CFC21_094008 [Triticum aestivum]
MDNYSNCFHTSIILSMLLLICFATHAQCGRILEDMKSIRVNIPGGLCARVRGCKDVCICCLVKDSCYDSFDECLADCPKTSPLDPAAAMNRSPSPSYLI